MNKDFMPPVSIEEFAAYLDGNLTEDGMNEVASAIHSDKSLQDIASDSINIDESIANYESKGQSIPDDIVSDDFEIPDITEYFENSDISSLIDDSVNIEAAEPSHAEDVLVVSNDINNNLNTYIMANTIKVSSSNYGETGQNIKDPIFIQQPDDHSCALRSQQIVLRDFGIDIPFKDLEKIAKDNGVYSDNGTSMCDVGKVLDIAGVSMHQVIGSNMFDLTNELAQGHRVIVGVDANELWYNNSITGKMRNWFDDVTGNQGGNHALIVAGVEVNPKDPNDVNVVLTDPGSGDLRIEYPMKQFMDAWKDTNCFMAATDSPAPYQYDPVTKMEVPSNFVVEHQFNQFVAENSYQLSPDLINIPQDYQPAFSEHLDIVGDVTYEEFKDQYENILEERRLFSSVYDNTLEHEETIHNGDEDKVEIGDSNHGGDDDDDDNHDDDHSDDDDGHGDDDDGHDDDDDGHDDDDDGHDDEHSDDDDEHGDHDGCYDEYGDDDDADDTEDFSVDY